MSQDIGTEIELEMNEEILKGMQMIHERLLRVETWMLNQEKLNEEKREIAG